MTKKKDYSKNHFCNHCDKSFALNVWRCPKCNRPLKSTPQGGIRNRKFLAKKVRY